MSTQYNSELQFPILYRQSQSKAHSNKLIENSFHHFEKIIRPGFEENYDPQGVHPNMDPERFCVLIPSHHKLLTTHQTHYKLPETSHPQEMVPFSCKEEIVTQEL